MIKKCLDCGRTFGRQFDLGKCPFCKSKKIREHNKKVKQK